MQKEVKLLEKLCMNENLFSYSEIYKIDRINDSCFLIYLFDDALESSQHIFVFCKKEAEITHAEHYVQKHLSLRNKMKRFHLYLCMPGQDHLLAKNESDHEVHYKISFTESYEEIERQLSSIRIPYFPEEKTNITYILMGLILAIYGMDYMSSHINFLKPWFDHIGIGLHHYLENDIYNMGMAIFSHQGLTHLGFNLVSLIFIGRILERHFSSLKYIFLICMSAICGALGSIAFMSERSVSLGASGFIMGLIGALIAVTYQKKGLWPKFYQRQFLHLRRSLYSILALNLIIPLFVSNIDSAAHICGFIGGFIISSLFHIKKQYKKKVFICIVFYFYLFSLEVRIEQKVNDYFQFKGIQNELISSLNTKENIMKRNILEFSKLNSMFLFELTDINGLNYPIKEEIAAKDPLLIQYNFLLKDSLEKALSQEDQQAALIHWKSKYEQLEKELLIKYKLTKANAGTNTK
ncbi:rhomboid family intramembrane serine protease, partial [bacterium]|nr:rhomboid family intramembrane serine protease [bacterium]